MTAEERIAEAFNGNFANFDICIEAACVAVGGRREIRKQGGAASVYPSTRTQTPTRRPAAIVTDWRSPDALTRSS